MPSNCKSYAAKNCRTASTRANDRCIRKKRFLRAQPYVAPERTDVDGWDDYDTVFIGDSPLVRGTSPPTKKAFF